MNRLQTIDADTLQSTAYEPPRERSGQPIAPIPVLLRIEFTASDTLEPTGALLPHLSILT